jgi:DNA invertase Pin-like site-specific DNA recombinase
MKIVAYYRVSTAKQGRSGLGLDAQRAAVQGYANGRGEVVAEFVEVETGKRADRPRLAEAMAHAKKTRATLVIAKLDRLARNVHFISGLMESGVPFDCADRPGADPFRLHIEAAVAEEEARKVSERTRVALAAAKERGTLLGGANPASRNLTSDARQRGTESTRAKAERFYSNVLPMMIDLREAGNTLQVGYSAMKEGAPRSGLGLEVVSIPIPTLM